MNRKSFFRGWRRIDKLGLADAVDSTHSISLNLSIPIVALDSRLFADDVDVFK